MTPNEFIATVAPAAAECQRLHGIPASFTIAQAALESGWGTSKTCQNACNLFNIKADKGWKGPTWEMASTEHVDGKDVLQAAKWRMYPDWLGAMVDRVAFFRANPRYAACFNETTGEGWAKAVADAGYATDPEYMLKLIGTMRSHNMHAYDVVQAS